MHSPGHVGIGLTLFVPVGYALVPADDPFLLGLGLVAVAGAAVFPDVDEHLPLSHRGPTHSILFVAVATVAAAVLGAVGSAGFGMASTPAGIVVGVAVALGMGSHLAVDGITPMGIRPWWPASNRRYTLDLVPSKHAGLNAGLLALGVAMTTALLTIVRG